MPGPSPLSTQDSAYYPSIPPLDTRTTSAILTTRGQRMRSSCRRHQLRPGIGLRRNVNEYSTAALVMRYGGVPLLLGIARDRTEEVAAKLDEAIGQGADLIVASAGVSVGAYDVVKEAVKAHGSIDLWKVRMRPGKPIAFGAYRQVPFFGLPGNAVSAMMTFEQFVRPALRIMSGFTRWKKPAITATLLEAIASDGRETYARAWVERRDGQWTARLSGGQGSNMLNSLARANARQSADAILFGAVGGPKWDDPNAKDRPERGLLRLRKRLGVFANIRPVKVHPALVDASPVKPEKLKGVDILVLRELTGGLYFGQPKMREMRDGRERAVDTLEYYDFEIKRILELAFRLAKGRGNKVTSVDKANVLESSRLWRQTATKVGKEHPEIILEHQLVDSAAMKVITNPASMDVVVTENMFGDILTDEASVLAGSMGMLPSASLSETGLGLYEPIHRSAPDIAGRGIANPVGTILCVAMMFRYSVKLEQEARAIDLAVDTAITNGAN